MFFFMRGEYNGLETKESDRPLRFRFSRFSKKKRGGGRLPKTKLDTKIEEGRERRETQDVLRFLCV